MAINVVFLHSALLQVNYLGLPGNYPAITAALWVAASDLFNVEQHKELGLARTAQPDKPWKTQQKRRKAEGNQCNDKEVTAVPSAREPIAAPMAEQANS